TGSAHSQSGKQGGFWGYRLFHSIAWCWCWFISNWLFTGRGINDGFDLTNGIDRKTPARGVLANHLRVRRDVNAIKLVVRDIALNPLDLRAEVTEDPAGFGRD